MSEFARKADKFKAWLQAHGAQLLQTTSEWEVVRFKSGDTTSIIYQKKSGDLTFTGESLAAWNAFRSNQHWRGAAKTKRRNNSPVVATLIKRDGDECFFCLGRIPDGFESVEHLVAVTHGGPNHVSNFVLAHRDCNAKAGHLSAAEKIAIRVQAVLARERAK